LSAFYYEKNSLLLKDGKQKKAFIMKLRYFTVYYKKSLKRKKIYFYLFIADFFATQIIGGAKELVVL